MGGDGGSVGATSCGLKYCHSDTALSGGGQQEVPALYFNQFIARGGRSSNYLLVQVTKVKPDFRLILLAEINIQ